MVADPRSALSLLLTQRACRSFTDAPVDDQHLHAMLEAATHAPSAQNQQPWIFVVVRDAEVRRALVELTQQVWAGGARAHAERSIDAAFVGAVDRFVRDGYGGAPVLVVVACDGRDGTSTAVLASSVYPAVQNLLLAASALGYGSSMTTLAAQTPDALARIVGLPDGVRPLAVVPVGRPARPLGPPRRRSVDEVAHLDRFGASFTGSASAPSEPPHPAPPPV